MVLMTMLCCCCCSFGFHTFFTVIFLFCASPRLITMGLRMWIIHRHILQLQNGKKKRKETEDNKPLYAETWPFECSVCADKSNELSQRGIFVMYEYRVEGIEAQPEQQWHYCDCHSPHSLPISSPVYTFICCYTIANCEHLKPDHVYKITPICIILRLRFH